MIGSLQKKLEESVSKVSELTDVLTHLGQEYTTEVYYEESAKRAMEPVLAAAQAGYGGGGNASVAYSKTGGPKSDNFTQSQITGGTRSKRF